MDLTVYPKPPKRDRVYGRSRRTVCICRFRRLPPCGWLPRNCDFPTMALRYLLAALGRRDEENAPLGLSSLPRATEQRLDV